MTVRRSERYLHYLAPVGRVPFLPLAIYKVTEQHFSYYLYSAILYWYFLLIQLIHRMFLIHNTDSARSEDQLAQKQAHYKEGLVSRYPAVGTNVQVHFNIATSPIDFIQKIIVRSDYYYDKYVAHLIQVILFSSYKYNPEIYRVDKGEVEQKGQPQRVAGGSETAESDTSSVSDDYSPPAAPPPTQLKTDPVGPPPLDNIFSEFTPKPYILSRRLHDIPDVATDGTTKPPSPLKSALTELFEEPKQIEDVPNDTVRITKVAESMSEIPIEPVVKPAKIAVSAETTAVSSPSKILYKIKIRRCASKKKEDKEERPDPTLGNYNLVRQRIKETLDQPDYSDHSIGPNMVRFTWHCCAQYDRKTGTGGSSGGTMRFAQEFNQVGNTGLHTAKSFLDQIHEEFSWISFADLYTLAGVVALEAMGGPIVEWKSGRTDCPDPKKIPTESRLPIGSLGSDHIHQVFTDRLGFNDKEIVALIGGGHALGGCHRRFSGWDGYWTKTPLVFTNSFFTLLLEEKWELGKVPETGMDQYYNEDKSLMMLNTDLEMKRNPVFREWTEKFAADDTLFREEFAKAFAKLLELGVIRDSDGIQRMKI